MLEPDLLEHLRKLPFVIGIAVTVQQPHRGATHAPVQQAAGLTLGMNQIDRRDHRAVGRQTLPDLDDGFVQRRRPVDSKREEIRPLLIADDHQVSEPASDEQPYRDTAALQQRVGPACRRQTHVDRRQVGVERRRRDHAGCQDRGLDSGIEFENGALRWCLGQSIGEFQNRGGHIEPRDADGLVVDVEASKAKPADEVVGDGPLLLDLHAAVVEYTCHASPQRAAAEHLGAVKVSAGINGNAIGERATGVDVNLPVAASHGRP